MAKYEDEQMFAVPEQSPAFDGMAFACRWFGLGIAIGLYCVAFVLLMRT
jgi:hypothetical protein